MGQFGGAEFRLHVDPVAAVVGGGVHGFEDRLAPAAVVNGKVLGNQSTEELLSEIEEVI